MSARKVGAPSKYSVRLVDAICEQIAQGIGVHVISTQPGMPSERTVYYWLEKYPEFLQAYTRARERAAERFAAEVITIADDAEETIRGVERARLRIDARKWAAGKFSPKKYGEKFMAELSGTVKHQEVVPDLSNLSDDELATLASIAEKLEPNPKPEGSSG